MLYFNITYADIINLNNGFCNNTVYITYKCEGSELGVIERILSDKVVTKH